MTQQRRAVIGGMTGGERDRMFANLSSMTFQHIGRRIQELDDAYEYWQAERRIQLKRQNPEKVAECDRQLQIISDMLQEPEDDHDA